MNTVAYSNTILLRDLSSEEMTQDTAVKMHQFTVSLTVLVDRVV